MKKILFGLIVFAFSISCFADIAFFNLNNNRVDVVYKTCYRVEDKPICAANQTISLPGKNQTSKNSTTIPSPPEDTVIMIISAQEKDSSNAVIAQGVYLTARGGHCGYPLKEDNTQPFNVVITLDDLGGSSIIKCDAGAY